MLSRYKGKNKGPKRTRGLKWEFGKMDIPLVASYSTPLSRRESSLFFSRPGPSRLQKLSVEDSYLLGQSDCHTFLRGPEDVSVKRGYTLPDRRVVSYMCVCVLFVKLLRSCLTLCDHMDYSPPGSSIHGILQERILEWVVMPFSSGSLCARLNQGEK